VHYIEGLLYHERRIKQLMRAGGGVFQKQRQQQQRQQRQRIRADMDLQFTCGQPESWLLLDM
jgi:hypothetical protein